MRLLGAGFGSFSTWNEGAGLAEAALQTRAAPGGMALGLPPGSIIRTILKDVPPEALGTGATLIHEHLSLVNWREPPPRPRRFLEDVDVIAEEVEAAGREGISCIVDCGHPEMGRDLEHLKQIAIRSGVHIVGSGGHYLQQTYPPEIARMTEDQITEQLVQEVTSGHLGAFGEIGSDQPVRLTADERKVFRAIGKAHLLTGLPIITHTYAGRDNTGKTAVEQLDILESVGVKPERVVIGHLDTLDDPQVHLAIAKRGAYVGFDRVGSERPERPWEVEATRVRNVLKFLEAGYADKLLLASDFATESNLKRKGGPGYALTLTRFVPKLRQAGVKEEILHRIMVDNPRRLLAFVAMQA